MARNKNSTALFDVIHAAKKPPKSSPSASIPAPRWWGKDKKLAKAPQAELSENVGKQQSWLTAAKKNAGVTSAPIQPIALPPTSMDVSADATETLVSPITSVEVEPAPIVSQSSFVEAEVLVEPESAPKTRFIDRFKSRQPVAEKFSARDEVENEEKAPPSAPEISPEPEPLPIFFADAEEPQVIPQRRPVRTRESRDGMVAVDPISHEIQFRLSYGGIAAIAFILLMALAIAFIAGTHSPFAVDTSDTRQIQTHEPGTSGMMAAVNMSKPASDIDHRVSPDVMAVLPNMPRPAVQGSTPPAAPLPIKATRDIGMIYVVIQSYPDQDLAQKACDFVNHAGVPCTLVQGLTNWARDWYSVIGLQPFKKHDPSLDEYERAIATMGVKFSNKIYNQFQPQGYTWRADSDQQSTP